MLTTEMIRNAVEAEYGSMFEKPGESFDAWLTNEKNRAIDAYEEVEHGWQ